MDPHGQGSWFIALTLLLALLLSIVPIDGVLAWARPHYLMVVLAYWVLVLPERIGVIVAFLCGFLLDILLGDVLGENAFSLAVIAYILQVSYQRLRMFSIVKQAGLIAMLSGFHVLVGQWAQGLNGGTQFHWLAFLPVFSTAFLWLFSKPLMAWFQRALGVN
ncbi:rod shape-determining protein MreD [Spongiibacter sp. IMCC21906]|uniref:rod shape-determining protein MreD n=1 Tax=Spongiibacter sp. IMCC21906 TaxID=1620392 RepID=UPI00062E09F7|nr:rod shape-determining protein MreD [Spongiibacter sp. IMCC21906]AKH68849.1 rod shape-determining protein MreD [Spongiibacter sp. IMCC21906]